MKHTTCLICGREFKNTTALTSHLSQTHKITTHEYYDQYIDIKSEDKYCSICGKEKPFSTLNYGYNRFCSTECRFSKNGVAKTHVVRRNTKEDKYGDANYNNIEKAIETTEKRYNGHGFASKDLSEKGKKTCEEVHGDRNYKNSKQNHITLKKTYWSKYLKDLEKRYLEPMFDYDYFVNNVENFKMKCNYCNTEFVVDTTSTNTIFCKGCGVTASKKEKKLQDYLRVEFDILGNKRFYYDGRKFYELDIVVPEFNLGIEFNGNFWHCEIKKPTDYHLEKTNYFDSEKNINVVHVLESEWDNREEVVKSIIMSKCGKYDSVINGEYYIKPINGETYQEFCVNNYPLVFLPNGDYLGVYCYGELISVICHNGSFIKLIVFKIFTKIENGMNHILNYFKNNFKDIKLQIDKRYHFVNEFSRFGFTKIESTDIDYIYMNQRKILHKSEVESMDIKTLKRYDSTSTDRENLNHNHYYRIYDCGLDILELKQNNL